jgi:hypothetical protein
MATVGQTLTEATMFVETGDNEGVLLAFAASLRPDIPMRSCEPLAHRLAVARKRCAIPSVSITVAGLAWRRVPRAGTNQ